MNNRVVDWKDYALLVICLVVTVGSIVQHNWVGALGWGLAGVFYFVLLVQAVVLHETQAAVRKMLANMMRKDL